MKNTLLLDASLLKESDCDAKIDYIYNHGLITREENYKMSYGTAGHKFIASYLLGKSIKDSLSEAVNFYFSKCQSVPIDDFRTIEHLVQTLGQYAKVYPRDTDNIVPLIINNKSCIELPFAQPLHALVDTTRWQSVFDLLINADLEVMILGTIDQIATIKFADTEVIIDNKFTAIWNSDSYFQEQAIGNQLKFYSWFCRKSGLFPNKWLPTMINGIFIKNDSKRTKDRVTGRMIPVDVWNGATYKRSPLVEFSDEKMEDFEHFLMHKIQNYATNLTTGQWRQNNNQCGTKFGLCQFAKICSASSSIRADIINSSSYAKRKYDPAEFQS